MQKKKNPKKFVELNSEIAKGLGIGNSTGLGMAPFIVNHPTLLNNWVQSRESILKKIREIEIVKEEMSIRSSMIEHPAARIADKILLQKHVIDVQVEVEKLNVPIAESFNKISVTVKRKKNNY